MTVKTRKIRQKEPKGVRTFGADCTNPIHLGPIELQLDDNKRLCNGSVALSVEVDDEDDDEEEEAQGKKDQQDDEEDQAEVEFAGEDVGWMDHDIIHL